MDNPFTAEGLATINEVKERIEFINEFKKSSYGIVALKNGFTLEDCREAGLLKDNSLA